MTFATCQFTTFSAYYNLATNKLYEGSLLYSNSRNFAMTIQNSNVACISSYSSSAVTDKITSKTSLIAGAFYI